MICRRKAYPPKAQAQAYDLLDQNGLSSSRRLFSGGDGGGSGGTGGPGGTMNPLQGGAGGGGYQTLPVGTPGSSMHAPSPYTQGRGLGSEGDSPASMEMAKFAALGEGTGTVVVDADLTSDTYQSTLDDRQQRLRDGLN